MKEDKESYLREAFFQMKGHLSNEVLFDIFTIIMIIFVQKVLFDTGNYNFDWYNNYQDA